MNERARRAVAFQRSMDAALAERAVPTKHGVAYFSDSLPRVWDRNLLCVEPGAEVGAAELAARGRAGAGRGAPSPPQDRRRRRARRPAHPRLARRGWTIHEYVVMPLDDALPPTDSIPTAGMGAGLACRVATGHPRLHARRRDRPPARRGGARPPEGRRGALLRRHADDRVAAYCELFSADGVGQVESVMCLEEFRGRGLGKAVTARAAAECVAAGHELTFLVADAADWPQHLYAKLGFREGGRIWDFVRER